MQASGSTKTRATETKTSRLPRSPAENLGNVAAHGLPKPVSRSQWSRCNSWGQTGFERAQTDRASAILHRSPSGPGTRRALQGAGARPSASLGPAGEAAADAQDHGDVARRRAQVVRCSGQGLVQRARPADHAEGCIDPWACSAAIVSPGRRRSRSPALWRRAMRATQRRLAVQALGIEPASPTMTRSASATAASRPQRSGDDLDAGAQAGPSTPSSAAPCRPPRRRRAPRPRQPQRLLHHRGKMGQVGVEALHRWPAWPPFAARTPPTHPARR